MAAAADAIFDVVRGVCTLASTMIVLNTAKDLWFQLYEDECPTCMGHGTMTCSFCHGSKQLRSRPGQIYVVNETDDLGRPMEEARVVQEDGENRECWHCGPTSQYDFDFELQANDEVTTLQIMENFTAAQSGQLRLPFTWPALAGTVPCPECQGTRIVHRHTPNLERFLNLRPDLFSRIRDRAGSLWTGAQARPPNVKFLYMEYPSRQPKIPEDVIHAPVPLHFILLGSEEEGELDQQTFSNEDAYDVEDFLLPYVDDDIEAPDDWP